MLCAASCAVALLLHGCQGEGHALRTFEPSGAYIASMAALENAHSSMTAEMTCCLVVVGSSVRATGSSKCRQQNCSTLVMQTPERWSTHA